MRHTPGPWQSEIGRDEHGNEVNQFYVSTEYYTEVAETCGEFDVETEGANANLIAAAPDLLEALEDLSDVCERFLGKVVAGKPARNKAKRVIAKAKGLET